ncbi:MAG: putative Competence protein ComEC [Chloroflexi bacterium]|nr:putative Competence protein ComEC [Chloroflexota bacterium]
MIPRSACLAAGAAGAALVLSDGGGQPRAAAAFLAAAAIASAVALATTGRPVAAARLGAVAVGVLAVVLRLLLAGDSPVPATLPAGSGPWMATVSAVSSPLDGSQRFVARLDGAEAPLLAVRAPRYPPVVPGDRVELVGRVEPPPDSEYGAYLARNGIAGTLRSDELALLPADPGPGGTLEAARRAVDAALARALPEPAAGLAAGILVGLRERVDRELATDFTATGLSHVLAISGWNIALVGGLAAALLARRPARVRLAATLAVIVGYTLFAGASASVVRAAAMAGVALVARAGGRPGTAAAALGLAVTGIVVAGPATCLDPGFQLSAAATAGLLAWSAPITQRLEHTLPWLPGWIVEGLGVSLAAQAATLPIVLLEFGRLAPLAPLLNLAVVPLVPAAMAAGCVAAAGGVLTMVGTPAVVAVIAGLPAAVVLEALVVIVRAGAGLPLAGLTLEPPLDAAAAGLAAGALVLVALRRRLRALGRTRRERPPHPATDRPPDRDRRGVDRQRPERTRERRTMSRPARVALAALALAAGLVIIAAATRPDGQVHVMVLDVGQGDAILVETGRGGRVLIDGGPDPDRLLVELDRHIPPWDRRLDLVILTHPHEDHVAGLPLVVERYAVGRALDTGARGEGPGFAAWTAVLARRGVPTGRLLAGSAVGLDGVSLRAVWPDSTAVPTEPTDDGSALNDSSIVILGEAGGRRFLLAGDMEAAAEAIVVSRGLPRVDLLKVGHHGSSGSSSAALLDALRPRVAVISVAARNDYGHPSPATLAALQERGVAVYRTDRQGTIEAALDQDRVVVRAEREEAGAGSAARGTATARPSRPRMVTGGAGARWQFSGVVAVEPTAAARRTRPALAARLSSGPCRCPGVSTPPPCSSRFDRRRGTSATRGRWPRSPPGSRSGPRPGRGARSRSTAASSRPPLCSTTRASSCPTTIRPGCSATARHRPSGSPATGTRSWARPSRLMR